MVQTPCWLLGSVCQGDTDLDDRSFPTTMSATFDDSSDEPTLYANNPEWADVIPLQQYEGVEPIAPIFYSEECPSIAATRNATYI